MRKNNDKSFLERVTLLDFVILFILGIGMITVIYPFWNSILISIVPQEDLLMNPLMIIPKRFDWGAYNYVFTESSIPRGFLNSIFISTSHVIINVLLTVLGGYIFTRRFPGRKALWVFLLIPSIIPGGLIPNYLLMRNLNILNNHLSLILPGCFSWSAALYMARYFNEVPYELEESARIDGASEIRIIFQIILPLMLPFIAVAALNAFVMSWNSWYNGMLYIRTASKMPLATMLRDIQHQSQNVMQTLDQTSQANSQRVVHSESIRMACVMTATIPIMCIYPFLQRFFIGGLTAGAVKG